MIWLHLTPQQSAWQRPRVLQLAPLTWQEISECVELVITDGAVWWAIDRRGSYHKMNRTPSFRIVDRLMDGGMEMVLHGNRERRDQKKFLPWIDLWSYWALSSYHVCIPFFLSVPFIELNYHISSFEKRLQLNSITIMCFNLDRSIQFLDGSDVLLGHHDAFVLNYCS